MVSESYGTAGARELMGQTANPIGGCAVARGLLGMVWQRTSIGRNSMA
eukprot:COSAG02_NODE_10169_length_2003_cov_2.160714_2_plen_48_part_00